MYYSRAAPALFTPGPIEARQVPMLTETHNLLVSAAHFSQDVSSLLD
jgi:hypothetical protein